MATESHLCHAHGCTFVVPSRMLFCRVHWFSTRPAVQKAVWREYRDGQENDKRASLRYRAVARLAIGELAFKPNDEAAARVAAPYLLSAMRYRDKAIALGHGDPLVGLVSGDVLAAASVKYPEIDSSGGSPAP